MSGVEVRQASGGGGDLADSEWETLLAAAKSVDDVGQWCKGVISEFAAGKTASGSTREITASPSNPPRNEDVFRAMRYARLLREGWEAICLLTPPLAHELLTLALTEMVPVCLVSGTDRASSYFTSMAREALSDWLDELEPHLRTIVLKGIAERLAKILEEVTNDQSRPAQNAASADGVLWTISQVGFRTESLIQTLLKIAQDASEKRPYESDLAIRVLFQLGGRNEAIESLLIRRIEQRPWSAPLIAAARFASPTILPILARYGRLSSPIDVSDARYHPEFLTPDFHIQTVLSAIATIAERFSEDRSAQESAFAAVKEAVGNDWGWAALSGTLPRIDCEEVVMWLVDQIVSVVEQAKAQPKLAEVADGTESGASEMRSLLAKFPYHLGLRLQECVRPSHLSAWRRIDSARFAAALEPFVLELVAGSGLGRTFDHHAYDLAWDLAYRAALPEVKTWTIAVAGGNSGPFVRAEIFQRAACLPWNRVPKDVLQVYETQWDVRSSDLPIGVVHLGIAAGEVVAASAGLGAIEALTKAGLHADGDALVTPAEDALRRAKSVFARAMVSQEEKIGAHDLLDRLCLIVSSDAEAPNGVARREIAGHALAGALVGLKRTASSSETIARILDVLASASRDEGRRSAERGLYVRAFHNADMTLWPTQLLGFLETWAHADQHPLSHDARALIAVQYPLEDALRVLREPLRLEKSAEESAWDIALESPADQTKADSTRDVAQIVGILFSRSPVAFGPAAVRLLESKIWWVSQTVMRWITTAAVAPAIADNSPRPELDTASTAIPRFVVNAAIKFAWSSQSSTGADLAVFDQLGRIDAVALSDTRWEEKWSLWLPGARQRLAEALGRYPPTEQRSRARVHTLLLALMRDSSYVVRRAAYRAYAELAGAERYNAMLLTYAGAAEGDFPLKAAEAFAYSPSMPPDKKLAQALELLRGHPDSLVRNAIEKSKIVLFRRRWAGDYQALVEKGLIEAVSKNANPSPEKAGKTRIERSFVRSARNRHSAGFESQIPESLILWATGSALATIGDDDAIRELEHLSQEEEIDSEPFARRWLSLWTEETSRRWKKITEKWKEGDASQKVEVEVGEGVVQGQIPSPIPVHYVVWHTSRPTLMPSGFSSERHSWEATLLAMNPAPLFPVATGSEHLSLQLEDGRVANMAVTGWSSTGVVTVLGLGEYPGRPSE